eukprot:5698592-Alexandrium_andersonii.AAC.1
MVEPVGDQDLLAYPLLSAQHCGEAMRSRAARSLACGLRSFGFWVPFVWLLGSVRLPPTLGSAQVRFGRLGAFVSSWRVTRVPAARARQKKHTSICQG